MFDEALLGSAAARARSRGLVAVEVFGSAFA